MCVVRETMYMITDISIVPDGTKIITNIVVTCRDLEYSRHGYSNSNSIVSIGTVCKNVLAIGKV